MVRARDAFERAWLAYLRAGMAIQEQVVAQEEIAGEATDAHGKAIWGLIETWAPLDFMVRRKLEVLVHLLEQSRWTDGRDLMLAASVIRDIDNLPMEAA